MREPNVFSSWRCSECKASNVIEHRPKARLPRLLDQMLAEHRAASPACVVGKIVIGEERKGWLEVKLLIASKMKAA